MRRISRHEEEHGLGVEEAMLERKLWSQQQTRYPPKIRKRVALMLRTRHHRASQRSSVKLRRRSESIKRCENIERDRIPCRLPRREKSTRKMNKIAERFEVSNHTDESVSRASRQKVTIKAETALSQCESLFERLRRKIGTAH